MTKIPIFSVLMANYNNGKYIAEAIASVRAQTYPHWEIIIVDDASKDDSLQVLENYRNDEGIKIYQNDKNHGCGYTKRRCAELATGEICAFLDPDDTITSDALEIMVQQHNLNKEASIVYSQHYDCDETLEIKGVSMKNKKIPKGETYLTFGGNAVSHFATFKRSKYLQTEGINPEQKRAVDTDLYYKLEEVGELVFIEKPLYYYRHNPNSISLNENEHKVFVWAFTAKLKACERRGLDKENILGDYYLNKQNQIKHKYDVLVSSKEYKFGKKMFKLLKPIQIIKHKLKKL